VGVLLNADNASLNWPTGQLDDPPPPMLSLRIEENVSPRYNSASSSALRRRLRLLWLGPVVVVVRV
jgi:hypothetical protein